MDRVIKDYKCTDCSAVFDRPGPCPKCPYGYRRPVVQQFPAEFDTLVVFIDEAAHMPLDDQQGPDDSMGLHGPGCNCGL